MKGKHLFHTSSYLILLLGAAVLIFGMLPLNLAAQKKTKVYIEHADILRFDKRNGRNVQKLIGDVKLKQDSTLFFCDSAFLDNQRNNLQAYGHVHINYNDSVDIYGDYLDYDGNRKIAELDGNVKLLDGTTVLTTDHLIYDRRDGIAYYKTGGRIEDDQNRLTSIIGRYNTQSKYFYFRDSVKLVNPDYILRSDTLVYNTVSEMVYIYGPTNIVGEKDSIYAENGWYDTKNERVALKHNAFVSRLEQFIRADSMYYDQAMEFGFAHGNIVLMDTVQEVMVLGEYARFDKARGKSFVTDSARAVFIDRSDSLFLHADTIKVLNDSLDRAERILAHYKMRFFRNDLQGACDSMVYLVNDSVIKLYSAPVLWAQGNQLTADSISIFISDNRIDSLALYARAFIASKDTLLSFNQIKGRRMMAYFKDNDLYRIDVNGNAETLYFVREEDGSLIGVNISLSSFMKIFLAENQIDHILYIENPDETLYPEKEITPEKRRLKDFNWQGERRPLRKEDIFRK